MFPKAPKPEYSQVSKNPEPTINGVHNPFAVESNSELTFIGRDAQNPLGKETQAPKPRRYKREMAELYGPVWIFITLIVEFVILGHMTNSLKTTAKGKGNAEVINLLAAKTADQSLKRIMKIVFFLGCFYFGIPFTTYLMFKSKQAFEVTFTQQLAMSAYAFVLFIPASLLIFSF
jgi:hypothetical protein